MELKSENKKIEELINKRINELSIRISNEIESYNTIQTIELNGCKYSSDSTYLRIRELLSNMHSVEDFNIFKEELTEAFIIMEKAELELNKELNEKLTFLNGYNPDKYEYNTESDLFIRMDELEKIGTVKEFNEIVKEQEKEEEAQILIEIDGKINDLFLN